ncbi:hypothetical protein ABIA30_003527 [Mycobacterium sp. MAA66]|uniref:hypothetical protein n=1 Tax=Mycobacterium sp. MAA66 TaxID=3156297 RepID=UPI0035172B0A
MAGAIAVFAAMAAGCSDQQAGSPEASPSASKPSATAAAGTCALPHFGYLLEWRHVPGKPDQASLISDIDKVKCEPALNNWSENLPLVPGACYTIGWASDNAGYALRAVPAPRPQKVMDKIGDGC